MRGLLSAVLLAFLASASSELSSIKVSILSYQGLKSHEIENMEHLHYTFDICLCRSHFNGLFPNRSPLCECAQQLRGRKVIESIPEGVYSASCVYTDNPSKCLNVKFIGEDMGRKILVKTMIGKTIYTYPTWQRLVFSPYRTTSTLKSATGTDMRITYTTMHRAASNGERALQMSAESVTSTVMPMTTTVTKVAVTPTRSPFWMKPQPEAAAVDVPPSKVIRNDWIDIIKEDFNRGKAWILKPVRWLANAISSNQGFSSFFPAKTTKITTTTPSTTTTTTTKALTTSTTKAWTTTTPRTTTTIARTVATTPGAITTTTPRRQLPWGRNRWDLSDVAYIKNVNDVRMFLVRESHVDRVDPPRYDINTVKDELLFYHNVYREMHDAPEVKRSGYLDSLAQRYSDYLAYSKTCLIHEQPRIYGENLFVFGSQYYPNPITFARAVGQSFYMEGREYNYNSFVPMGYYRTGHFTQLVWRESRNIGIGITVVKTDGRGRGPCFPRGPAYMIYVCVKYDPAGNYQTSEAYKRNVWPLKRRV